MFLAYLILYVCLCHCLTNITLNSTLMPINQKWFLAALTDHTRRRAMEVARLTQ